MRYRPTVAAAYALLLLLTTVVSAETFQGKPIEKANWKGQTIEYVQGDILLALNPGYSESDLLDRVKDFGLNVIRGSDRFGFMVLEASSDKDFFELLDRIAELESVRFAEPNQIHRMNFTPNDPYFSAQWHYHNTGQSPPGGTADADIDAPEGWEFTIGSSVIMVGVLDTGIPMVDGELSHPDLDDPARFVIGLNTFTGENDPVDGSGHGTHVSGTIGAEINNGIGVAGVASGCRVMALKTFNDNGSGSSLNFRDGVIYAVDNGCHVLNYSGGGSGTDSYMEHAVAYADTHGVILCASAGNNWQGSVGYPAAYATTYDNVICVSATDHNDESSPYSSVGPEVTVSAPGGHGSPFDDDDVISTFPNYTCQIATEYDLPLNYAPLAGTSMACPHVTGFAALILSVDPTLTPLQVKIMMIDGADDLGPSGYDEQFGWGRINLFNTLLTMGEINIGHQPLENTKNYTSDYRVDCAIFSVADLILDSLLLYYDVGSGWEVYTLQLERGTSTAHGWIPFQDPGTYIDYYLFVKNVDGITDSTDIYTFKVIDYQVMIEAESTAESVQSRDTAWYPMTVTNDGTLVDRFDLDVTGNVWSSSMWNSTGTQAVTETASLMPGATYDCQLRVIVPYTDWADWDSAMVVATSQTDPSQAASLGFLTTSTGEPLLLPFLEDFSTTDFDIQTWIHVSGATIGDQGVGEPSAPYSAHFDGDPDGADTIVSQIILIEDEYPSNQLNLVYSFQQTGGGESPDAGDDLFVEYLNDIDEWVLLNQHFGADPDMTSFEEASVALPADAYHDQFRIRIRNTASPGIRDDWFVDDITLVSSPTISVTTSGTLDVTLAPDQSTDVQVFVENIGAGDLHYDVEVIHDFSPSGLFADLMAQGLVESPSRDYPPEVYTTVVEKGSDAGMQGYDVLFNAGGPDDFGYYWIDSDEPEGPVFDWVDISSSGTLVTGLTDDSYAGPFPIGFDFDFYDSTYSEFYISSNGFIGFGPSDNYESMINKPIPYWDVPNNIIALLWDDLNLQDANNPGAEIRYQSMGDRLVIQYINMPEYLAGTGDVFNGEIIIKQDGSILLQYLDFGSGFDKENCTVGIENEPGFIGLEIVYSGSYLHDNLCVVVSPSTVYWLSASPSSGVVASGNTETVTMTLESTGLGTGTLGAEIQIHNNDPENNPWTLPATLTVERDYIVGDANGDRSIDIDDVVCLIDFIFAGGPEPNPIGSGDADCSGHVDIDDAVFLISFIFAGGPGPCE